MSNKEIKRKNSTNRSLCFQNGHLAVELCLASVDRD